MLGPMLLATAMWSFSRGGTAPTCTLPSFHPVQPRVPGSLRKRRLVMLGALCPQGLSRAGRLFLQLRDNVVLGTRWAEGERQPQYQAANSILSSGYFSKEPAPSSTKSVCAPGGFKLQPNLAPSSHAAFLPEACEAWQARAGESREPAPSCWPPGPRRPSIPGAASWDREVMREAESSGGGPR